MKKILFKIKNTLFFTRFSLSKDFFLGKFLDFFTVAEIRRSNSFKAVGRAIERFILNRF